MNRYIPIEFYMKCIKQVFIFCCVIYSGFAYCQVDLTLRNAEELFQKNNLLILAEQYSISEVEASVIQAKIWELPILTGAKNATYSENWTYAGAG